MSTHTHNNNTHTHNACTHTAHQKKTMSTCKRASIYTGITLKGKRHKCMGTNKTCSKKCADMMWLYVCLLVIGSAELVM
jgi:hypothetical protein